MTTSTTQTTKRRVVGFVARLPRTLSELGYEQHLLYPVTAGVLESIRASWPALVVDMTQRPITRGLHKAWVLR